MEKKYTESTDLVKKLSNSSSEVKIADCLSNLIVSLNLTTGATTFPRPGSNVQNKKWKDKNNDQQFDSPLYSTNSAK